MRHKYETRGIVLARAGAGENHAQLAILTADLGLLRARATGVRHTKSKLAHALVTFAQSELTLVAGREGWRVTGAVLEQNWFVRLASTDARRRAARVTGLLLRLSPGEAPEAALYPVVTGFFEALGGDTPESHEGAELVAASSILAVLGFDSSAAEPGAGEDPAIAAFSSDDLAQVLGERERYIARINRGIEASGL
ncbi:MAG TPA: recombination protein O N-terminal domain-containing protein [Candidatus Paceibacterota bacterium]